MTIKLDQGTILQLGHCLESLIGNVSEKSSYRSTKPCPIVNQPLFGDGTSCDSIRSVASGSAPDLVDTDDDCTYSSSGSYDSCAPYVDTSKPVKRVSFSSPLVTEVRSRPPTLVEDLTTLFYTAEETQRFRQQYRLERLLYSGPSGGGGEQKQDQTYHSKKTQVMGSNTYQGMGFVQKKSALRQCISRIVVMHNNIRDIFVHEDHAQSTPISGDDGIIKVVNSSDHFFDNDNFWNGSLTWFDHSSGSSGGEPIKSPVRIVNTQG